jgi:uncharacterized protein
MMKLFRRRPSANGKYRIYFATDIHGSDRCFRKFLAAVKVYEADALILGGDIAGKAIVPITKMADGRYVVTFQGEVRSVDESELEELKTAIGFNGLYPYVTDEAEAARLSAEPAYREQVFERLIADQVAGWCTLANERLDPSVPCIITPGNDDPLFVDAVLEAADRIECPERELMEVGPVWLASMGDTNRTPWDTDREYDEDELTQRIDEILAPAAADGRRLLLNFHCPPYDSGLDTAAQLDNELRPVVKGGAVVQVPVGSTAVRAAIEKYTPGVALHGHIHESHGVREINGTLCINPGSEYSAGVLKGAIVDFDSEGRCLNHLLTSG